MEFVVTLTNQSGPIPRAPREIGSLVALGLGAPRSPDRNEPFALESVSLEMYRGVFVMRDIYIFRIFCIYIIVYLLILRRAGQNQSLSSIRIPIE